MTKLVGLTRRPLAFMGWVVLGPFAVCALYFLVCYAALRYDFWADRDDGGLP